MEATGVHRLAGRGESVALLARDVLEARIYNALISDVPLLPWEGA